MSGTHGRATAVERGQLVAAGDGHPLCETVSVGKRPTRGSVRLSSRMRAVKMVVHGRCERSLAGAQRKSGVSGVGRCSVEIPPSARQRAHSGRATLGTADTSHVGCVRDSRRMTDRTLILVRLLVCFLCQDGPEAGEESHVILLCSDHRTYGQCRGWVARRTRCGPQLLHAVGAPHMLPILPVLMPLTDCVYCHVVDIWYDLYAGD
jgi:hypothetical protein